MIGRVAAGVIGFALVLVLGGSVAFAQSAPTPAVPDSLTNPPQGNPWVDWASSVGTDAGVLIENYPQATDNRVRMETDYHCNLCPPGRRVTVNGSVACDWGYSDCTWTATPGSMATVRIDVALDGHQYFWRLSGFNVPVFGATPIAHWASGGSPVPDGIDAYNLWAQIVLILASPVVTNIVIWFVALALMVAIIRAILMMAAWIGGRAWPRWGTPIPGGFGVLGLPTAGNVGLPGTSVSSFGSPVGGDTSAAPVMPSDGELYGAVGVEYGQSALVAGGDYMGAGGTGDYMGSGEYDAVSFGPIRGSLGGSGGGDTIPLDRETVAMGEGEEDTRYMGSWGGETRALADANTVWVPDASTTPMYHAPRRRGGGYMGV